MKLFDTLSRKRLLLIAIFALVTTVVLLESYAKTPMYRAQARLMIQDERSTAVAGMNSDDPAYAYWRDPEQYYQTQYRILQSPSLAERTLARSDIDLDEVPEFNGTLERRVGPRDAAEAGVYYGVTAGRAAVAWLTRTLRGDTHEFAPVTVVDATMTEAQAQAATFLSRIAVQPVVNTRLVDVSFSSADPAFAARAVQAFADEYVNSNLELRLEDTNNQLQWARKELVKYRVQLEDSERAIADYRVSHDALSLEERQDVVVATLQQLNDVVNQARNRRIEKESIYRAVTELDDNPEEIEAFLEITGGPYPKELLAVLDELRRDQMAVAGRYGEKHPRFIAINLAVDQTRDELQRALNVSVGQIRMEYELAVSEEAQLMQEFEAQKRVAMNLDLDSVNYNVLQREAGRIRNLYESLLKQEKELSVVGTSRTNNVRLMERAMVPGQPYSPDRSLDRFTAVTTGLLFSVGFIVLLERVNNKIRNPDELRRGLGIPVFGFVPAVPGNTTAVLSDESPHELVESLRSIRTTLIVTADTKNHAPVIAVTSTHPLEGKTTTACSLALTLAQGGSRVLLMDADLRRPSVHKALNLKNRQGLTEMLSQTATPREVISRTDEPNLFVITAGAVYENPPELLGSSRMKEFLEHVSTGHFDWVILDTPPVLAVTDALLLAPLVSAVAFVVLADSTSVPHARQALALLHEVQAGPVVGAILNRVETASPGYGYERYYGRRYDSYYGAQAA